VARFLELCAFTLRAPSYSRWRYLSSQPAKRIPFDWKTGMLTRVASGQEYMGTYATGVGIGRAALAIPIIRNDQVYVILGGGMEYVVVESGRGPAHVIVNAPIPYAVEQDKFYFGDQKNRLHTARIARQTLVDPAAASVAMPRTWKSVANVAERYFVRQSENTLYAEMLLSGKQQKPLTIDAKLVGDQFIGQMHWTERNCAFSSEVDLTTTRDRIEGYFSVPVPGAKLD
jgi:hypothetical protein